MFRRMASPGRVEGEKGKWCSLRSSKDGDEVGDPGPEADRNLVALASSVKTAPCWLSATRNRTRVRTGLDSYQNIARGKEGRMA